jgi:hypothetical protein
MLPLVMVSGHDLALGDQPMFFVVTRFVAVLLPEFIGAATDLVVKIDGHDIFAGLGPANFPDLGNGVGCDGGNRMVESFPVLLSRTGARGFGSCHSGILLANS